MAEATAPNENTPEGTDASRKKLQAWEDADITTLGPCPADLRESTFDIRLPDGFISKAIVIRPVARAAIKCPLIVYFHGGGFAMGTPRFGLSPGRAFASRFGAIVVCPSYKLAPEHPFPAPMQSAWEVVAWLSEPQNLASGPLHGENVCFDPSTGFVLAGCSAGASLAAVVAGIAAAARSGQTVPMQGVLAIVSPITGLFVSLPHLVHRDMLAAKYAPAFRSREENANAPIIDAAGLEASLTRLQTDVRSPWYSPLNLDLASMRAFHPPRVYVHGGALDVLRDDAIIYERVLQEEAIAETRIDVLDGYGHIGWVSLPLIQSHTNEIREKSLDGMAWLLQTDWDRTQPLPY